MSLCLLMATMVLGCSHTKVNVGKVHEFAEDVTRSQTAEDKANVAQVKHVIRIADDKLGGKLYEVISEA